MTTAAPILLLAGALALTGCIRLRVGQAPHALLTAEDLLTWDCQAGFGCTMTGTLHNLGTGCASHVQALVRLYGDTGQQVGEYHWALPSQQVVDPKDDVVWHVAFIPGVIAEAMRTYTISADWESTQCNLGWLGRKHRR